MNRQKLVGDPMLLPVVRFSVKNHLLFCSSQVCVYCVPLYYYIWSIPDFHLHFLLPKNGDPILADQTQGRRGRRPPQIMVPSPAICEAPVAGPHLGRHRSDGGEPRASRALRVAAQPRQANGLHSRGNCHSRRARSQRPAHRLRRRHSPRHSRPRRALPENKGPTIGGNTNAMPSIFC